MLTCCCLYKGKNKFKQISAWDFEIGYPDRVVGFFLSLGEPMGEGWRMTGGDEIRMCGWEKMGVMRGAAYSHNVCAASLFLFFL